MMDTYFETDTVSMNTALNKLAGIPNSPSRKLLTPSKLQKNSNGTCNTTGSVPVFKIQMMDMKTILENILLNSLNEIVLGMKATSFCTAVVAKSKRGSWYKRI